MRLHGLLLLFVASSLGSCHRVCANELKSVSMTNKQRLQLFIIHEDAKDDMYGGGVGFCNAMLHYAMQLPDAVILVNKNLWATAVDRIAEYALRAKLNGTPEQLIKQALDKFTSDSRKWYEQLDEQGLSESERWCAALHQARSEVKLSSLATAIKKKSIGAKSLQYAMDAARIFYAPYNLEERVMFRMPGDYYCFVPRSCIAMGTENGSVDQAATTTVEHEAMLVLSKDDIVSDPKDEVEFFRTCADMGEPGQVLTALEHLLKAQQGDVIWDIFLHAHGVRYDNARPGIDGLWRVVAGLGINEVHGILSLLKERAAVNLFIIGSCYSGGQTAREIAEYAREHAISFPIMTSTAFDTVSSCYNLVQDFPIRDDGTFNWDIFTRLFCHSEHALRPFKGPLTYRPDIPENIFEKCPCPITEQNVFQWCQAWKQFVPPMFENIPSIILPGKDPIVLDERKITLLDTALAKLTKRALRYGSPDCETCVFNLEKRFSDSFPATCVLLEAPYIDCEVCIEGVPRIISVMPERKCHHIGTLTLEQANLGNLLEMVFQLEGCAYECLITVDTLHIKADESLSELLKKTCNIEMNPSGSFSAEKVLIWVSTGYQRQPSIYAMINNATVLRINRLAKSDKDAKHPCGYQLFTGNAAERYEEEFIKIKEAAYNMSKQGKDHMRSSLVVEAVRESKQHKCRLN